MPVKMKLADRGAVQGGLALLLAAGGWTLWKGEEKA